MKEEFIAHWRKSDQQPQYLWDHLEEASSYASQAAEKIGLKETGEILGWMHDLGKFSQKFQNYIRSATGQLNPDADGYTDVQEMKGKIDHSTAGAQFIYNTLHGKGKEKEIAAEILPLCIASHHSGLIDVLSPTGENDFLQRMEKSDEDTHLTEIREKLTAEERLFFQNLILNDVVSNQLAEKLISIKEQTDQKDTYLFKCGLLIRYLFSCVVDADRLSTAEFETPLKKELGSHGQYQKWDVLEKRLDAEIQRLQQRAEPGNVNSIREEVSSACFVAASRPKGLYELTVPTGGGKTLSSLRFGIHHAKVHRLDHIFYMIPYTSIIDQNAARVREILEDRDEHGRYLDRVVLEHHSNLTPEEESFRHNLLAENWDAPIIFTTQVQFLETLFGSGTRSARRMHQLANSVLIFDEIQTLPIRCVHMFNLAVRFLVKSCGSTVVLCTATQPLLDKVEPPYRALSITPEQHIISDEKRLFTLLKRVEVHDERKPGGWHETEIVDLIMRQAEERGNVLVVVNTKKSARRLFEALSSRHHPYLYHLSTNMCPTHRLDVLGEMKTKLKNGEPLICISTQLIEAGVDMDFRTVIRYLAGLDSITQAAGRCNREGRSEPGQVWVINPADENLKQLAEIIEGAEITQQIFDQFKADPQMYDHDRLGFKSIEDYYRYYFYQKQDKMCYQLTPNSPAGREDNLFNLLALNEKSNQEYKNTTHRFPSLAFTQSFKTAARSFYAIDSVTRGVIVPYKHGKEIILQLTGAFNLQFMGKEIHDAQRYSVNLYPYQLQNLAELHAVQEVQPDAGILYLDEAYYDQKFGLKNVGEMKNLIY